MKRSYSDIQEIINTADLGNLPKINISILRNIMLEPIEPYIKYLAYEIGINATVQFGEYDNIFQEAVEDNSILLNHTTDIVLIFMKLESVSWELARNFNALSQEQLISEIERIKEHIESVLVGIRRHTDSMVLWHGFELPAYPSLGILDYQLSNGQMRTVADLNIFLRDALQHQINAYFVDINLCLARLGFNNFYDSRYWHIGRAPFTREALYEIAQEDFKFIRALKGKNKKCLVLDCDGTLWGGVIGEDGLAGIKLGKNHPGSAYYEFQQEIVNLYHRGVIIALCSKNNEDDVWDVFRHHPDMVLKEEHIATAQINWTDKAANLKQIASDLNIGLDSVVFMDDNEFELNLIHDTLPEVEVINLHKNKAVEYRNILASCGLFDTLAISEEDKRRGAMYKAETLRKIMHEQATDLHSYLRSLKMIIEIRRVDDFSIPRIAQLTQKTNQFNLTTLRYSDADITKMEKSRDTDILYMSLKDRFGDYGIVGVCILKYNNDEALIDTLLLSCRVLGRGVEDVFLIQALKRARKQGCLVVSGEYVPTKRNAQVANFYAQHGFTEVSPASASLGRRFCYEISKGIQTEADFFYNVISEVE